MKLPTTEPQRWAYRPLSQTERQRIKQALTDAGHESGQIGTFLFGLDYLVTTFREQERAISAALPLPALVKELQGLVQDVERVRRRLGVLQRRHSSLMQLIADNVLPGSVVDLDQALGGLQNGAAFVAGELRQERGRPQAAEHKAKLPGKVAAMWRHCFGVRPTGTQGNTFEQVLQIVLAATGGECSDDHLRRQALSAINSLKKNE